MTWTQLLLIVGSACLHVVAHVALRRPGDRYARAWWLTALGAALFLPVAVWRFTPPPPEGWALIAVSAVFEAGYFLSVARAYEHAPLSVVYPIARGAAPALLLVWAVLLAGERPALGGYLGVALIVSGLYVVNLPGLGEWSAPLRALAQRGPRWALAAGAFISMYTLTDRYGIEYLDPLAYTTLALALTAALMLPAVVARRGWGALRGEWAAHPRALVVAGFTTVAAYAIVLYVIQSGVSAAYAGAAREMSVVLGALIGLVWFREPGGLPRLLGACLVAVGVVCLKILG